jgi:hypothetical protein
MASRELTPLELEKVEAKLKDLKSNKRSFVKRYGKDAEKVMRGRAISSVKKETEKMNKEQIRELIKSKLMGPVKEIDIEVGADRYEAEQDLSQASAMMDELESLLKGFDWYYYMSDDPRVYKRWGAIDNKISDLVRKLESMGYGEDAKSLYNQYAPDGDISMKMKEAKGKDMDKDGDIDSDDYLAARDAAIKKAKGEVDEADMQYVSQQREKLKKATDAFEKKKRLRALQQKTAQDKIEPLMREDIDLGHEDNEPHMIKAELYRVGKYAMELYAMLEEFEEMGGEVDFPGWWQAKITTAMNNMVSAKHYLDFEIKEPAIDAAVDALTGEEPHMGEPEPPMMEADKDKEGLMYAIATNLKKYGRPQSKASDKPAKLTKGLEKGREKYVKKLKKHMTEEVAEKLAKQLKSK